LRSWPPGRRKATEARSLLVGKSYVKGVPKSHVHVVNGCRPVGNPSVSWATFRVSARRLPGGFGRIEPSGGDVLAAAPLP